MPLTLANTKSQRHQLELLFQLKAAGLPEPVGEYRFDESRRWRFDWAWVREKVAVEVEGGVFSKGRHLRPEGFLKDIEKYNQAVLLGWRLFRVTPQMVSSGEALTLTEKALK